MLIQCFPRASPTPAFTARVTLALELTTVIVIMGIRESNALLVGISSVTF